MTIRTARRSRLAVTGALTAVLLTLVTACAAPAAPSGGDSASDPAGSAMSAEPAKEFLDWQLKFAECMRDEGIDMPDPSADGSGQVITMGGEGYDAAMQACLDRLGPAPSADGRSDEQVREDQLKTAKCLRDAGYDVPDPEEGMAMGMPADLPEDVFKTCVGSIDE